MIQGNTTDEKQVFSALRNLDASPYLNSVQGLPFSSFSETPLNIMSIKIFSEEHSPLFNRSTKDYK